MDFEYDVMGSVDDFCNTKIEDIIEAHQPQTVTPNDSFEIAQLEVMVTGSKASKTRGKQRNEKLSDKKTTAQKQPQSKISRNRTRKLQSEPAISEPEISSEESSDIDLPQLEIESSRSQRGKARRKFMSELASSLATVGSLDLTVQAPAQQIPGRSTKSKKQPARQRNNRQQSGQKQQSNSNVIYIGSDEEDAGVIYEPINIKNQVDTQNSSFSILDEQNPEYSVKIEWLNKIEAFPLRKYQKFLNIFEILSKRENADIKDIILNLNSKIIDPNDSPDSINYLCFDIISGRVVKNNNPVTKLCTKTKTDSSEVCIKLQSNLWKKHIPISIKKTDTFKILYIKCSEELKLPFEKFTLMFDGDNLAMEETPNDLNLDDGEIIDCVVKKDIIDRF